METSYKPLSVGAQLMKAYDNKQNTTAEAMFERIVEAARVTAESGETKCDIYYPYKHDEECEDHYNHKFKAGWDLTDTQMTRLKRLAKKENLRIRKYRAI
jgi:hypothetical protein